MGNNSKSSYVRGVFTQVHFRVEEVRGSQVKPLALGPTGRKLGREPDPSPWILCTCALLLPLLTCSFLPQPLSRSSAPAQSTFTVTSSSSTCLDPHHPTCLSWSHFPLSPVCPHGFSFQLCVKHLDYYPSSASEPARLVPSCWQRTPPPPSSAPVSLSAHTGKFLKVAG